MINRHQELRSMATQILVGLLGSELILRGMTDTDSINMPTLSKIAVKSAKTLRSILDDECEASGHDYRTPKSGTELYILGDDATRCFGCGKEKSDD